MVARFPSNTKETITSIINQDGRVVSFFVIQDRVACPTCSLDPITDNSTDSFCPTCSGVYWLETYSGFDVVAHVTWGKSESKAWETGGMVDNGDCTVKFIYSGTHYDDIIFSSQYVIVDRREMDIDKIILRGVPEVNRVIVALKEKER
jgi:hypothetical protein